MVGQKNEKGNPLGYLFAKTWQYSAGNRKSVALYWALFVVAMSLTLFFQPLLGKKVMDIIQVQGITHESLKTLWGILFLVVCIKFVFWVFHGPARVLETVNAFRVRGNYRKHLLQGIMNLPMDWHVAHHSGETIDKVEKGASALYQFSQESFQIVYAIVQFVGSFFMLSYFSPSSIPIVLGMMCISVWITLRFDRVMIPQYRALSKAENMISENVFDSISNIPTVIILRVERLIFMAISHRIDKPADLFKRNSKLNEVKWFMTTMCTSVMTMLVLGVYFWQHLNVSKTILIGTVYILTRYLDEMSETFFRFTSMYSDIVKQKARLENGEEVALDFREECLSNHVLPDDWQLIEVRDLNFSYDTVGSDLHLTDVNLSIKRGERIALVGATGSGKTSFLKIVRCLYQPQRLKLLVDGKEIVDGFGGISSAIALVPQNPDIFGTSIGDNITLGAEYDQETVLHFTEMACFTSVLRKLPKGFDSAINERGVNLSGGENQRLALARGLLASKDKSIVLLDEPTSSLDTATEMTVYDNIFSAFPDKTIISSIHRLHLLSKFDQIHFFEDGRIIASGTLEELLTRCPQFQQLWMQYRQDQK